MHAPTPGSPQSQPPDNRRTRRNVIAMAGILGSIAATIGATTLAHAMGSIPRGSGNGGSGNGGIVSFVGRRSSPTLTRPPIENLGVGDMVSTVSGESRAIKQVISWTAERKPNRDWTDDVAPIKICRSALAPNVPHRDLYLSPGHALYLDGVLIAAQGLVNDRSIVRCSKGAEDRLTYFQLDLEDHQVIFAEGAPVESCFGDGMILFAPRWFENRKSQLASRLRSAISPWVDRRKAVDKVRDHLDVRGEFDLVA